MPFTLALGVFLMAAPGLDSRDLSEERVAAVEAAIAAGADVNAPADLGRLPLTTAAQAGSLSMVRLLLRAGAKPDAKDPEDRSTALSQALIGASRVEAELRRFELATVILDAMTEPSREVLLGGLERALEWAALFDDAEELPPAIVDFARRLIDRGLARDDPGVRYFVHHAAREGQPGRMRLLARLEVDLDLEPEAFEALHTDASPIIPWRRKRFEVPLVDVANSRASPEVQRALISIITSRGLRAGHRPDPTATGAVLAASTPAELDFLRATGARLDTRDDGGHTARYALELRLIEDPDDALALEMVARLADVALSETDERGLAEARRQKEEAERDRARVQAEDQARWEAGLARHEAMRRGLLIAGFLAWVLWLVLAVIARETALREGALFHALARLSQWTVAPLAGVAAGALIFVALDLAMPDTSMHSYVHFGRGFALGVIAGPLTFLAVTVSLGVLSWQLRDQLAPRWLYYLAPALGGLVPLAGVMLTR